MTFVRFEVGEVLIGGVYNHHPHTLNIAHVVYYTTDDGALCLIVGRQIWVLVTYNAQRRFMAAVEGREQE